MDSFNDCGIVLKHALAHAEDLRRCVLVNREGAKVVAKRMGLPVPQVAGAVRLLRHLDYHPSDERLALIAMNDFGLEDQDIAEMWSRPVEWATTVRRNADALREAEPIPRHMEYLDEGLQPDDPCPEELWRMAAELRSKRDSSWRQADRGRSPQAQARGGMRCYSWMPRHDTYVSVSPQKWTGR
jgi:hypothetical protein